MNCVAEGEPLAVGGLGGKAPLSKPLIIGVTGGIASGKSTVARMISGRGIAHVDADKLVHQLLQHDHATIAHIAAAFPGVVILSNSEGSGGANAQPDPSAAPQDDSITINRAALAAHITRHPESLATLEALIHPRVRAAELAAIDTAHRNKLRALVLDIPLLFETDADQLCDVVVVAHASLHHRRRRAFARAGMTEEKWQRLLARQLTHHHRHPRADVVIHTGVGKAATRRHIQAWMKEWGL